jgi:hypothetical protein
VRHFAGDVAYHSSGVVASSTGMAEVSWIEKNNDSMNLTWLQTLAASTVPTLSKLFTRRLESAMKTKITIGKQFVTEVNELVAELKSTHPLFIRCIKPNMQLQPALFEEGAVLDQLRCCGLLGAVKLVQETYPTRVGYATVLEMCEASIGAGVVKEFGRCHPALVAQSLMKMLGKDAASYTCGRTKLFMKMHGDLKQQLARVPRADAVARVRMHIGEARLPMLRAVFLVGCAMRWRMFVVFRKRTAASLLARWWRDMMVRLRYLRWALARRQRIAGFKLTHQAHSMLVRRHHRQWAEERLRRIRREYVVRNLKRWLFKLVLRRRMWKRILARRQRVAADKLTQWAHGVVVRIRYRKWALARRQRIARETLARRQQVASDYLTRWARGVVIRIRYLRWSSDRRERIAVGVLTRWGRSLVLRSRYRKWALARRQRIAAHLLTRWASDVVVRIRYRKWALARRQRIAAHLLTCWTSDVLVRVRYLKWSKARRERLDEDRITREADERAAKEKATAEERERMQMWQSPADDSICITSGAAVMLLGDPGDRCMTLARHLFSCQRDQEDSTSQDIPANYFEVHVKTLGPGAPRRTVAPNLLSCCLV